mgnify:FL=1
MTNPRVLSGIQPTAGSFHVGNYLGALRQWVSMQETHDTFYTVVDLHALTVAPDPAEVRERTLGSFAQLIAIGIDPLKSTLFVQSHVREHSEMMWLLSCITGFGEASRMTQFKDKSAKQEAASVGLFTYPILQAADILLYQADEVPVGEDQRQHLELTRDLAGRFNSRYGQTFTVPKPHIVKDTAKIVDLQEPTAKMSKSLPSGCVFLLEPLKAIEKKIKSAVTDSETVIAFDPEKKPGVSNLLTMQSAFTGVPVAELVAQYDGQMYGALKKNVADVVIAFAEPFQQRVNELLNDEAELHRLMKIGADRATEVASATTRNAQERMGLIPR